MAHQTLSLRADGVRAHFQIEAALVPKCRLVHRMRRADDRHVDESFGGAEVDGNGEEGVRVIGRDGELKLTRIIGGSYLQCVAAPRVFEAGAMPCRP
eukprot:SAG11_NODE_176_length_13359_cov_10.862142_8_plen_97_part_00